MVVEAARKHGIATNVCGAMGGEPLYAMLLLGLGIRQLSMPPHQLPEIKRVIRGIRVADAEALAAEALRRPTAREVVELLESALRRALPETAPRPAEASRPTEAAGMVGQAAASIAD